MIIRICDICQKNGKTVEIKGAHRLVESTQFYKETRVWDLCTTCMDHIISLIGEGTRIGKTK